MSDEMFFGAPTECQVCADSTFPVAEAEVLCDAHRPWRVLEIAFTATPADAEEKFQAISNALTNAEAADQFHRPAYRSRIAWENGTLDYTYEVSVHGFKHDLAVETLMHHGLMDNPSCLVLA